MHKKFNHLVQQPTSFPLIEWLKLIELSMAMVLGSVKDDKCFSNLGFMNNKLNNILTTHLDLVVKMFT
jgi:hypothetical protein